MKLSIKPTITVLGYALTMLTAQAESKKPNIVFLFSDDHALNAISAYGGRLAEVAPTPNIDKLAEQGAIFKNSFCANSICGPSRANILSGKHSHKNGFIRNAGYRLFAKYRHRVFKMETCALLGEQERGRFSSV